MGRSVKISWEFEEGWWQDQGWGGNMMCDGPIQQIWDGSMGEAPILTAYICGSDATKWAGHSLSPSAAALLRSKKSLA